MKLTNKQLRQIIKEELEKLQNEMINPDYAESHKLDLNYLSKIANNKDYNSRKELRKALQLISNELFNQKLDPSGAHAKFYYQHISLVDPNVDMDKMYPESDPNVDMDKMYPEERLDEALSNDIKDMAMSLAVLVGTVGGGAAFMHADATGQQRAKDQFRSQYEIGKHSVADMEKSTRPDLSKVSAKNRYEVLKKSVEQTAAKNNMDEADVWLKVIHGAYKFSPDTVDRKLKNLQKDIDFDAEGRKFDMELDAAIKGLTYENKKRG